MTNRPKTNKYTKIGFGITVELPGTGYIVRANILKNGEKDNDLYEVTLELRKYGYMRWDMLDREVHELHSQNINLSTYDYIMQKYKDKYFDPYIEWYEYDTACINSFEDKQSKEQGVA